MTRLTHILLLLLIIGASLVEADEEKDDSDEDSEEDEEDDGVEREILILTTHICKDARSLEPTSHLRTVCCKRHYESDEHTEQCWAEYQHATTENEEEAFLMVSKVANCLYKKKKYKKGESNLNFRRIRTDARKLHNKFEQKFYVNMFVQCDEKAKADLELIAGDPSFQGAETPFFGLVYLCVYGYSKTTACPYFRWFAKTNENLRKCQSYARECRKLLDLTEL